MKWRLIQCALLAFIAFNWGNAAYIFLKAELAQVLIKQAWSETLNDGQRHYPWPWADSWPIARLRHNGGDLYVLAGAHGTALAFGPGHLDGSEPPGEGHSVIGGHRDTHFAFLRDIALGAPLQLQTRDGRWSDYQISARDVVDIGVDQLLLSPGTDQLQLVTCYPFDTVVPGGPLRLNVIARPAAADALIIAGNR